MRNNERDSAIEELQEQMNRYVSTGEMPAGELYVHQDGLQVFHGRWGTAKEDTIYRMASLSKVMTVVGFMKLWDQKLVALDDPVSRYLPDFTNPRVVTDERITGLQNFINFMKTGQAPPVEDIKTAAVSRELTIRDLLTHSSGLEMGLFGLLYIKKMVTDGAAGDDLKRRAERYSRSVLDFEPGTGTGYSPLAGLDLIARIIEVVSGMDFAAYMRQEVFEPLAMKDACYHLTREQRARLIPLLQYDKGTLKDVTGTEKDIDTMGLIGENYSSGSAGVYCRADDLDHLARMLVEEGSFEGRRILSREAVQAMQTEHAVRHLEPDPGMEWGLGVKVRQDPQKAGSPATKGTYGWSGAFGTHMFISPKDHLAVAFSMNRADMGGSGSYISRRVEELIFSIWGEGADI